MLVHQRVLSTKIHQNILTNTRQLWNCHVFVLRCTTLHRCCCDHVPQIPSGSLAQAVDLELLSSLVSSSNHGQSSCANPWISWFIRCFFWWFLIFICFHQDHQFHFGSSHSHPELPAKQWSRWRKAWCGSATGPSPHKRPSISPREFAAISFNNQNFWVNLIS